MAPWKSGWVNMTAQWESRAHQATAVYETQEDYVTDVGFQVLPLE